MLDKRKGLSDPTSLARLPVIHGGKWKSVSKIKLNFHFAFFPLLAVNVLHVLRSSVAPDEQRDSA